MMITEAVFLHLSAMEARKRSFGGSLRERKAKTGTGQLSAMIRNSGSIFWGGVMEYTKLGRSGLWVSRLCLGTMNFGSTTEEKDAFYLMDAALDAGINFFDTANNYGFLTGNPGITETIIGKWFAQGGGRREKVVLATKVHEDMGDPLDGPNTRPGLSAYKIRRHLEASLKRLQTDHVELYYMHHVDRTVSWQELWDVFENLYDRNLIDYVGTSNFPAWKLVQGQAAAEARHFFGIAVEQDRYNLNGRLPELEVLPACRELGIGFVAWGPLDGGLLSGKGVDSLRRRNNEANYIRFHDRLEQFSALCRDAGMKEAEAAQLWLLQNPDVTAPIIGVRTMKHLESCLHVLELKPDPDFMEKLNEIFPGPGGEAPEAYGW